VAAIKSSRSVATGQARITARPTSCPRWTSTSVLSVGSGSLNGKRGQAASLLASVHQTSAKDTPQRDGTSWRHIASKATCLSRLASPRRSADAWLASGLCAGGWWRSAVRGQGPNRAVHLTPRAARLTTVRRIAILCESQPWLDLKGAGDGVTVRGQCPERCQ